MGCPGALRISHSLPLGLENDRCSPEESEEVTERIFKRLYWAHNPNSVRRTLFEEPAASALVHFCSLRERLHAQPPRRK